MLNVDVVRVEKKIVLVFRVLPSMEENVRNEVDTRGAVRVDVVTPLD